MGMNEIEAAKAKAEKAAADVARLEAEEQQRRDEEAERQRIAAAAAEAERKAPSIAARKAADEAKAALEAGRAEVESTRKRYVETLADEDFEAHEAAKAAVPRLEMRAEGLERRAQREEQNERDTDPVRIADERAAAQRRAEEAAAYERVRREEEARRTSEARYEAKRALPFRLRELSKSIQSGRDYMSAEDAERYATGSRLAPVDWVARVRDQIASRGEVGRLFAQALPNRGESERAKIARTLDQTRPAADFSKAVETFIAGGMADAFKPVPAEEVAR